MGLYNPASGAAAIIGSLAGGGIAALAGYRAVWLLAAVLLGTGLFINVRFLNTLLTKGKTLPNLRGIFQVVAFFWPKQVRL